MKSTPADEMADRAAEERSENEGMPEHAGKARDPVQWAADRGTRVNQRKPERLPAGSGMFGVALMSCAVLAVLGSARGALRWLLHRRSAVKLPH